jgi:hypothetical protein
VQLCRDIVARVTYPVPARAADPRARYVTMAKFFYEAMDAVRAMPPGTLSEAPNGELPKDSLTVFLMVATRSANEIVRDRIITMVGDETARQFADELQLGVVAFRRAIGIVGGADESFWTPARPQPTYSDQTTAPPLPDDPEPEPRRRWWWKRR